MSEDDIHKFERLVLILLIIAGIVALWYSMQ